ncbi:restriction endonuclease subunit S [Carnobacterium maltaromaticum]|uniref:restriction endonuclease subunit S n=1 Tax=Carnobacterium maltaromaticum TaxID=2751 RepID=UPI0039B0856D
MKNNQLPEVRFPEFKDAWELRKAKVIFKSIVEKGKENLPVLSVTQKNGVVYREDVGIDIKYDPKTLNGYKVIHPNNFVISLRSFQGGFELSDKLGITSPAYTIFEPVDKNLNDNLFWKSKFKTFDFIESLKTVTFGIRDGKSISFTEFGDLKIIFPSKEEQEKIGIFFKSLDDTIALYQHKLNILKQTKQGFLQKMFPKEGEKVPEIRFPGFTDDWENRNMGSILIERNELISENSEYPLMSFVQGIGVTPKGERYDRSFLVKDSLKKYKKTELDDFIYSSNNLETGSIGFNKTGKALISPVYSVFSSINKIESQFIGVFSTKKYFINKMLHYRQGVVYGQWRIHEKDFLSMNIRVPLLEEQRYIVNLFKQLDDTIALHQRELDILKNTKKAFLQKMFV